MDYGSIANYASTEGTATTTAATITFPWRSLKIMVMNDSGNADLLLKLTPNHAETITLKAGESFQIENYSTKEISLQVGSGAAAYRVWAFG